MIYNSVKLTNYFFWLLGCFIGLLCAGCNSANEEILITFFPMRVPCFLPTEPVRTCNIIIIRSCESRHPVLLLVLWEIHHYVILLRFCSYVCFIKWKRNPHISKLFSLSYMQISLLIFLSLSKYSFSLILCFCFWISKAYNCYMWRGSHVDEQVLQKCCWPFLRGGEGKEGEGRSKDWRISRQRLLGVSHWGLRASWNPDGLSSPYPSLHSLLLC